MNTYETDYLNLLRDVKANGIKKGDRTGVGTLSCFKRDLRINLQEGFPILTTKKVFFRGIFEEMQFFLRGRTQTKELEAKGINYWKGNTSREFLDKRGMAAFPEGDMGCGYGHQIRNFGGSHVNDNGEPLIQGVDQLAQVIDQLQTNPNDRRIIISMWNPSQLYMTALPPCHVFIQFWCNPEKKELNCFFLMRSVDTVLGLPYNVVMYALLTHYLAKLIGYTANELCFTGIDSHIYLNHLEQVDEQLSRNPHPALPDFNIGVSLKTMDDILNLQFGDIHLSGYNPMSAIEAPMAI